MGKQGCSRSDLEGRGGGGMTGTLSKVTWPLDVHGWGIILGVANSQVVTALGRGADSFNRNTCPQLTFGQMNQLSSLELKI